MSAKRPAINWEAVKVRLRANEAGLEKALVADPARIETIYRQRAEELARRGCRDSAPAATRRVLVFVLGSERYALDAEHLVEIVPVAGCTPVPGAPPHLLGVTNLRGEVRSVVDLGRLLELPQHEQAETGYILLLRHQGREVTLRVDRVEAIQNTSPEEVEPAGSEMPGMASAFLHGLTPDGLRLLRTEAVLDRAAFIG